MPEHYDVVVVGAGPAGSAAAYHLASGGASVLIVERKRFPRHKVCGDVLTPRAVRALARLGLGDLPTHHFRVRGVRFLRGSRLRTWSFLESPLPVNYGSVIPRIILDDRLRLAAEGAGAVLWQGTSASGLRYGRSGRVVGIVADNLQGSHEIGARLTILADGATGFLSRRLRAQPSASGHQPAFALRQYVEGLKDLDPFVEFHLPLTWQGRQLSGYGWICPVSASTANVGVGFLREEAADEASLLTVFEQYLRELSVRDARFAGVRPLGSPEGGVVPLSMADPFAMPRGVLPTGDAAGLANPYLGEGIVYALESGELAARSALTLLRSRATPTLYAKRLVEAFPRQWAMRDTSRHYRWVDSGDILYEQGQSSNRVIAALSNLVFDHPPEPDPSFATLARDPVGRRAHHLFAQVHRAVVERVRAIDPVVAEVVALLPWLRSAATLPVLLAAAVASPHALHASRARAAILAVSTFALSQVVHDDLQDGPAERTHAANTVAILVGDCLLGEAAAILSTLPRRMYAQIASALREAGEARLAGLARSIDRIPIAARYHRLAAPARTLASVLARSRGSSQDVFEFVNWFAPTYLAVLDIERRIDPDAVDFLRESMREMRDHQRPSPRSPLAMWLVGRGHAALTRWGSTASTDQQARP